MAVSPLTWRCSLTPYRLRRHLRITIPNVTASRAPHVARTCLAMRTLHNGAPTTCVRTVSGPTAPPPSCVCPSTLRDAGARCAVPCTSHRLGRRPRALAARARSARCSRPRGAPFRALRVVPCARRPHAPLELSARSARPRAHAARAQSARRSRPRGAVPFRAMRVVPCVQRPHGHLSPPLGRRPQGPTRFFWSTD